MKLHLQTSLLTAVLAASINYAEAAYDWEYNRYYDVDPVNMTRLLYHSEGTTMDLSEESIIEATALNLENYTPQQDIVYRDGTTEWWYTGDTAPGVFTAAFTLEPTSIKAGNILSIKTKIVFGGLGNRIYAFGFSMTEDGVLRFSRNKYDTEVYDNIVEIGKLTAGTVYEVTLTSIAQPLYTENGWLSASGDDMYIGRGPGNFIITLTSEDDTQTITTSGFGLDGDEFGRIIIGDSASGMEGSISNLVIKTIPEPTTSILSLLSLAALAARRRRK